MFFLLIKRIWSLPGQSAAFSGIILTLATPRFNHALRQLWHLAEEPVSGRHSDYIDRHRPVIGYRHSITLARKANGPLC